MKCSATSTAFTAATTNISVTIAGRDRASEPAKRESIIRRSSQPQMIRYPRVIVVPVMGASRQVDEGEEEDPDDVHEVPVEARDLDPVGARQDCAGEREERRVDDDADQ